MKNLLKFTVGAACAFSGVMLWAADPETEAYGASHIDARLNVTVKPDTDTVHFVRDNADPDVVTKTYLLKHADPYEIRGYLRQIARGRRIAANDPGIQTVKFNDGTSIIMVSAEEERFEDSEAGKGFDSLIEMLDKPGITSQTGAACYLYMPHYRTAEDLEEMLKSVGADTNEILVDKDEEIEMLLNGGIDLLQHDTGLNMMFFKTSLYSRKYIEKMLKEYDCAYPEIRAKITVYELDAENDTKLGLDFQAWKNNDGIDFFNTGGRFMRNANADALFRGAGPSDTTFFNFNPKWNTKYLDFLTSKGKAKVVLSSEISVRNGEEAKLERFSQFFYASQEKAEDKSYDVKGSAPTELSTATIVGTDRRGNSIIASAGSTVTATFMTDQNGLNAEYLLRAKNGSFSINGNNVGKSVRAMEIDNTVVDLTVDGKIVAAKSNKTELAPDDRYGFSMAITPSIGGQATKLKVEIENSSLIGYTSDGSPRIQSGAKIATDFMISNSGSRLVIGGIEKKDVVRVSGGLPLLKDLPLLGWLFSTESESTKRSQMVVVAEIVPTSGIDADSAKFIDSVKSSLGEAGETNSFGYRQFGIDKTR